MHESHDLELLSDLATGRSGDHAAAESLVDQCPECAELFHSHVAVLEAIGADTLIPMSDLERQRIRSSVWAEITPRADKTSRTPWWYRVAPVAAALVVVVGVTVPLLNRGDSADLPGVDAFETVAESMAADEDRVALSPPASDAAAGEESAESTSDTAANLAADGQAAMAEITAAELEETAQEFAERTPKGGGPVDPEAAECASSDPESPGEALATEPINVDGVESWLVAFIQDDGSKVVRVYTSECAILLPAG